MKKKFVIVLGLLSVLGLLLGACAPQSTPAPTQVQDVTEAEEPLTTETEEAAPLETEAATEQPTEEVVVETEEPVALDPVQEVVDQWLVDWDEVFKEDAFAMADNMGGQFGAGSGKNFNADEQVFEFINEGEGIFVPLNTLLRDFCGEDCKPGTAIAVTLQPIPMSLNFRNTDRPDLNDFGIEIDSQMQQSVYWIGDAYKEPFESQLEIQPDTWYTVLIAITEDGKYKLLIWQSDSPENMVSYTGDYGAREDSEGYLNVNWKFAMWDTGAEAPLKVKNYAVYTFAGFEE